MKIRILGILLLIFAVALSAGNTVKLTILYDNYICKKGTEADWGFACLIEGPEKTVLFDTGTRPDLLKRNCDKLNVDLNDVDIIVLSHEHGDHTGGLDAILEMNPDVTLYFPVSFSDNFGEAAKKAVRVKKPVKLPDNILLTGEMGTSIREQSLILETAEGVIVVTGCSHQGVVSIVERAMKLTEKPVEMIFGGFHLMQHSESAVDAIIKSFQKLGVNRVGATHCTGDRQIDQFRKAFDKAYVGMGVGKVLEFEL